MKGVVRRPSIKAGKTSIIIDQKVLVGVLKVEPVNIDLLDEAEQNALHKFYQELLDTVSYPVNIYSRQTRTDLSGHVEQVRKGNRYPRLRSAYTDHCRQLAETGVVDTEHFIVVRVTGKHEKPGQELGRRLKEIVSVVSGGELSITHLRGDKLRRFAEDVVNRDPVPTREFCASSNTGFDEYRKMVYVEDYPTELGFGWPVSLLRVNGLVDVTQSIRPVEIGRSVQKLRRNSEKLDAEIAAFLMYGHHGVNRLERSLDDVEWFLDLLAGQECRPIQYGVYITAHGSTRREARNVFDRVVSQLRVLGLEFQEPGFRNDYAYYTDSPFFPDRLDEKLLMPTVSAATGFGFGTQPFEDRSGVLFGVSVEDGTPILLDRFNWDSHSMAVLGTLGSGKSYSAKLLLLRSALNYPDLQVIVVDPKKEYRGTVEALGGEMRTVEHGMEYSFDQPVLGYQVEERGELEAVAALADLTRQIYSSVSKNRDPTLVLIDEARLLLDDDAGRHALNQFVLEARDINTALHLVTQSGSHFTDYREGRDMLDHIPGTVFFRHENVSDSMIDYFKLSEQEEWDLLRLRTGKTAGYSEALLRVANKLNTKIRINSNSLENQVIENTGKPVLEVENW